jgi:lactoylglutathione lyase
MSVSPEPTSPDAVSGVVCGFFHAGVTVSNIEEGLRFYRDLLGLELESLGERSGEYVVDIVGLQPETLVVAMLKIPGSEVRLELFEYRGIERHSASSRPCDPGAGHFCLFVNDLDALHGRLVAAGYSTRRPVKAITSGPHAGAKTVYATGPDGYIVELYQRASSDSEPV